MSPPQTGGSGSSRSTRVFILVALLLIPLCYEGYTVAVGIDTISEGVRGLARRNLFVGYLVGVLTGHWLISPPLDYTLAGRLHEVAEVVVVLALGGAVFVAGLFVSGLPWYGWAALLLGSIVVGAFCWTLGEDRA